MAEQGFEGLLTELEEVVGKLEGSELSLEDALAAYTRGVELSRLGAQQLEGAERQIIELKESLAGDQV